MEISTNEVNSLPASQPFCPESVEISSESEEDSDDDVEVGDEWSGANDYIEAVIFQAVYPDLDLAAYLISKMYVLILTGSSKRIGRKVSSWRKRVMSSANESPTTSTVKAAASK